MKSIRKNQFGDTIIEVILAITVLSIVLGISYSLASRGYRTLQIARDHMQATFLAQEQAEALRAVRDSSSTWTEFKDTRVACDATGYNLSVSSSSPNYWQKNTGPVTNNNFTTKVMCDSSVADTYKATITITWPQIGTAATQTVTIVTVLRNTF